ncbi:MAG: glycosyltransferase family 2 protein [Cytophagales bacterium]|nr:glycosyltransferase family 2 protein [Cytophagales bacterium]MDW8384473.1 glycosyltransferase family 2 protein [Flammeovirgaceae bacterium]
MSKVGISAVIICFNEEHNIKRCLDSLNDVADEIIVVDSFSTDTTPQICQQYPKVRFFQKPWENYSVAKNYGDHFAQYSHILSLDADECLSSELREYLLARKTQLPDAMRISRLTNYCGNWIRHCGWYPDYKTRLWRKELAHWEGIVHESLVFHTPVSIETARGDILHYSYYTISDHLKQLDLFTDLMSKAAFQENKKAPFYKILLSPFIKFLKSFLWQKGFLDGYYGWVICVISSFATFIKYVKLRELHSKSHPNSLSSL